MIYLTHKDLLPSVRDLYKKGGPYQKAAETVQMIIGRIHSSEAEPFKGITTTKHGESRIEKCKKYDLTGFARLITVNRQHVCLLLFAGDHKACDKWLRSNQGLQPVVDDANRIDPVRESPEDPREGGGITGGSNFSYGKLWKKLDMNWFELLTEGLSDSILGQIKEFESTDSDKVFSQVCSSIDDQNQRTAVYDVLSLLRQGDISGSVRRVELFLDVLTKVDHVSDQKIETLKDGEKLKIISVDSPAYKKLFEHFIRTADYKDWMLFMHPDQDRIVGSSFAGPSKLTGVSGSGKTCIVVKRAIELAQRYPDGEILVLTLNRPLAALIQELIKTCIIDNVGDRITAKPFFELCQQFLREFEPQEDKLYDEQTWKSKEHIDEIWREYYRCELNYDRAKVLQPVHDSLIGRGINAEEYIREEFDWIRSVVSKENRREYIDMPRKGRSYPLDEKFRYCLIDGLSAWEKKMKLIGVTDHLGIAAALYAHRDKLSSRYRCALVDECQDFGTLELDLIRRLVVEDEDDLFFTGDAAQHVSWKHQSLKGAGINVPGARSLTIKQNYRNSRDILQAAHTILFENITDEMEDVEDFVILDPEFADFEASIPSYLKANDLEHEIGFALEFLKQQIDSTLGRKGCLVICGYSLFEIRHFGRALKIPVLDGTTSLNDGDIFLSDLEQTKGFEFDTVCIVNLSKDVVPNVATPPKEQFRDLARLYVAMTRAKTQLVLSYSKSRSTFFDFTAKSDNQLILDGDWPEFVEVDGDVKTFGVPKRLEEMRQDNIDVPNISEMTGSQFLYTEGAIGLPTDLVSRIRELIPGTSRERGGTNIRWKDMGSAAEDAQNSPASKKEFGDRLGEEFLQLAKRLEL
jgi:superfamily I DNA/RNA helicase